MVADRWRDEMDHVQIWALRHSVAYGWRWVAERGCSKADADAWLAVFRRDEPTIRFRACARRPKDPS